MKKVVFASVVMAFVLTGHCALRGAEDELEPGAVDRGREWAINMQLVDAAHDGDLAGVVHALAHNADVNAREESPTALIYAADLGRLDIVRVLVHADADLNVRAGLRRGTPLMLAVLSGDLAVVQFLVGLPGIDLNAQGAHGNTALTIAVSMGRVDMVQALVNAGADVDVENFEHQTARMLAEDLNPDQRDQIIQILDEGPQGA